MMSKMRALAAGLALLLAACSSASPQERAQSAELAALAPLKQTYNGVIMGFDFPPGPSGDTTLIVSLDIQNYIGMDDPAAAAMKRNVLAQWRAAWTAAHPNQHATITVRMIDFVGRKLVEESARV